MKRGLILFILFSSQIFSTTNIKFNSTIPANIAEVKFESLADFSIDAMGNIYIVDDDLAKVFCFDKDGKLLKTKGHLIGNYLKEPIAIEISKDNRIIILDADSKRVLIYKADGKLLKMFGNSDGNLGSFDSPVDMAIDNNSNIFIVDDGNNYLLKFNSQGLFRGGIIVSEPIAVDVDTQGNIHILTKTTYGYGIEVFNENFKKIKNVPLAQMKEPKHFTINSFNEYYIIDVERCSATHIDSAGKPLSKNVGVKSSNRGREQFSKPTRILSKSIDRNDDLLFILDNDFNEIQSFTISNDVERKELKQTLPQCDLNIIKDIKRTPAIDIVFNNGFEYSITINGVIICSDSNKIIYTISSQSPTGKGVALSEPVALEVFGDKLFVVDKDENKVLVFNSADGSYAFSFGESGSASGKFDTPTDIVSDGAGNLYVTDLDNNRINVFSSDGIFKNDIPTSNLNPNKLTFSDNNLYILAENGEQIFVYSVVENRIKVFPINNIISNVNATSIASKRGGFLFIFNENDGVVYIFRDKKLFAQFLSKGNDESTIWEVSTMGFNQANNYFLFFNNKTQRQRTIKFSIAPAIPINIKYFVNNSGVGILAWETSDNLSANFIVSRRKLNGKTYNPLSEIDTNYFEIDYKNSDTVYNYVVQAVSQDGFKSGYSEAVVDEYSYYLKLKETDAKQSIKKLLTVKSLNEVAIINQIMNIYSTQIIAANNKNNFDLAFELYDEMKRISPTEPSIYLDESNLYKKLLRFNEGVAKLEEATKVIPDNLKIWLQLIRFKALDKNYEGAITSCNDALKIFPDKEKLEVSLAENYAKLNKKNEASRIYKKLALKHSKEKYYIKAGNLLVENNLIQDAINLYQLAENSGIEGAKLYAARGKALIEKGDFANGEFQIEKSIKLDNKNAESYYYLAQANSKKRNMRAAIAAYKKSVELDNRNYKVFLDYGIDLVRVGKYDEAIVAFEKAIELNPNSVDAAFNLGRMYARKKNLDLAVKHLSNANTLFPENKEIEKELSNALLAREKYNKKRPPIEITIIDFDDIFPSYLSYYNSQPLGAVTIFNTKNEIYDDIIVEVTAPGLLSEPSKIIVPIIYPNEASENLIYAQLDNSLITASITEDKEYSVTVTATYMKGETKKKIEKKSTVKVYQLNSISWKDKKHLASFINPRDEILRNFATSEIIAKTSFADNRFSSVPKPILQSAQVWEYLRQMNLTYVQDPNLSYEKISMSNLIDYVQFPIQTLEKKTGDCDDLVSLLSNTLEVLGIETAYIDVPGHVFLAFNTGLAPNELEEKGLSNKQVIIKFNKVWFPLETTVIGKNSFVESWKSATNRYAAEKAANSPIEIVEIQNAAITYPPINFPNSKPITCSVNIELIKSELEKDLKSFKLTRDKTYEEELHKVLKLYPKNIFTFNKLGVYYAKKGEYDNAEIYFTRTLQYDKENIVALTNLGNLGYLRKDFGYAERKYLKALKSDQQNVGILANLVRCYIKQKKNTEAIKYYNIIEQINPEYAKKIKEIK